MMNANDVLIDLLEDNRRRILRLLGTMSDQCVFWRPEADANNIAVTIWHMARIFDVFLTQQAKGDLSEEECWFHNGWAKQTGYDPRGLGLNGWGMLTEYTQDEVAAVPLLKKDQLLKYLNEVYDAVKEYLICMSMRKLLTPGSGLDRKYTKYQWIQMALLDNVRHLGEIYGIQARWSRQ
jgi:DinB superfamily